MTTMVWNFGYVTRHYRFFAVGVAFLVIGMLVATVLDRSRLKTVATPLSFLTICALAWGGHLSSTVSPVGSLALLGVVVLIVWRLRDLGLVQPVVSWASLFLALSLAVTIGRVVIGWPGTPPVLVDREPIVLEESNRDVLFVVLDGFPSSESLREAGLAKLDVQRRLERLGFQVDPDIGVSYSLTHAAIPSMMSMSLVMDKDDVQTQASRRQMSWIQGGGGRLFETFRSAGYHVTLVESGWAALRCVDSRDTCIVRPWIDDGTYSVIRDSAFRPLLDGSLFHDWHAGIQRSLQWIDSELGALGANERADFVFLHLVLPHPPNVFDPSCNATREDRANAFEEQMECTLSVMEGIVERAEAATIVFVGDHGSDTAGQMGTPSEIWTQAMIDERMHTLGAVRGVTSCKEPFPELNTNIGVYLVRCLGGDVSYVPNDTYIAARFEKRFRTLAISEG